MPMVSDLYPTDWDAIALAVKEGADWICGECGLQCRRPGEPFDTHRRTMSVAHYDSDYASAEIFVVALCSRCHNRLDVAYRLRNRRINSRLRSQLAGQRVLLGKRLPELSRADWQEMASVWPGHAYLDGLEDGIDHWIWLGQPTGQVTP